MAAYTSGSLSWASLSTTNPIKVALTTNSASTTGSGGYYAPNGPSTGYVTTWTNSIVYVPPVDPGPSNEEVDEAIRSIRRTIEKRQS